MTDPRTDPVVRLTPQDAPLATEVMCDAFRDYPVMRFVLRDDISDRRLRRLIEFFVMARALRDEPILGVTGSDGLLAAATVSVPSDARSPPALASLREEVWRDLGLEARERYEACGAVWRPLTVEQLHLHVNMIGVRRAHQGQGLARRLLDYVHRLSDGLADSVGVTLTTEDPANVPFYRHMGYEVVGHARIADELETWGMFRPSAHSRS